MKNLEIKLLESLDLEFHEILEAVKQVEKRMRKDKDKENYKLENLEFIKYKILNTRLESVINLIRATQKRQESYKKIEELEKEYKEELEKYIKYKTKINELQKTLENLQLTDVGDFKLARKIESGFREENLNGLDYGWDQETNEVIIYKDDYKTEIGRIKC